MSTKLFDELLSFTDKIDGNEGNGNSADLGVEGA